MKIINFITAPVWLIVIAGIVITGCSKDDSPSLTVKNPATATKVIIDRFSDEAATLMKRSANNELPGVNEPINFDTGDFITQGLGPDGQVVKYYNFDVQPLSPAPLYVLFKPGESTPVENQLNIIDVVPGDAGYSDFWQVYKVTVPADYVANTVADYADILSQNYSLEKTSNIINCPLAPFGSTASMRLGQESADLHAGWYKNQLVYYFTFEEKDLTSTATGLVPISPIYVSFNINPDDMNPDSGPPSGAVTETGTLQTHNVIATIPSDTDYSPLWSVYVYDNADFNDVTNLLTAENANILLQGAMYVNCPVVYIE